MIKMLALHYPCDCPGASTCCRCLVRCFRHMFSTLLYMHFWCFLYNILHSFIMEKCTCLFVVLELSKWKYAKSKITLRLHRLIWKYFHEALLLRQNTLLDKMTAVSLKTTETLQQVDCIKWTPGNPLAVLTQVLQVAIKVSWKVHYHFHF